MCYQEFLAKPFKFGGKADYLLQESSYMLLKLGKNRFLCCLTCRAKHFFSYGRTLLYTISEPSWCLNG